MEDHKPITRLEIVIISIIVWVVCFFVNYQIQKGRVEIEMKEAIVKFQKEEKRIADSVQRAQIEQKRIADSIWNAQQSQDKKLADPFMEKK